MLQVTSLIEVVLDQFFYRAQNYSREGVPHVPDEDLNQIKSKKIDKINTMINVMQKYRILDNFYEEVYDDLHKLRKYRNKIHIQGELKIDGVPRDEVKQFTDEIARWSIELNWEFHNYFCDKYPRPDDICGYVDPLSLPRLI